MWCGEMHALNVFLKMATQPLAANGRFDCLNNAFDITCNISETVPPISAKF